MNHCGKKIISFFYKLILYKPERSVGINNTDPKAQLDISSTSESSPEITDEILIPQDK
ncbi:hypothetical protein GCM10007103_26250 [Salinimicrobium marinum]|uniref:Uncharacterized protein n=1 Tax=Salinimicrobium marinum TaxID=680283 RepID=A0A918W048_9FLAO|nr:hypothetical protein GCM10007103_26250 [Salinimicrobium marinum]